MTTVLTFDQSRCRRAAPNGSGLKTSTGTAEVLMFTGVRRETLHSSKLPDKPHHHEPMFNDPAPDKPSGKKRRRSKNG